MILPSNELRDTDVLNERQIRQLWALYQSEWWSADRSLQETQMIVSGSTVNIAVLEAPDDNLVGYSRVISDRISKALILDVIVAESHRGRRLGERLMERITGHPALSRVKHFELYCLPGMSPFYERWGFAEALGEMRFMRLIARR